MTGYREKDFSAKQQAREAVWDLLQDRGAARFPFPPAGRIPNFEGAQRAARRLLDAPAFEGVGRIKVNPDSPQLPLRAGALERGIQVVVPTPRLKAGFKLLDPAGIPEASREEAASLSHMDEWARELPLEDLPELDLIVAGSVAVTAGGRRCGKGEGYSDLEFAILRELGHPAVPVVTTVHDLQLVGSFPSEDHDIRLSWIATPSDLIETGAPVGGPEGIDWDLLAPEDLEAMPVLEDLRAMEGDG